MIVMTSKLAGRSLWQCQRLALGAVVCLAAILAAFQSDIVFGQGAEEVVSESLPDPMVLKRLQSFRGPYSTLVSESPLQQPVQARVAAPTKPEPPIPQPKLTAAGCRPPECGYRAGRVVVKLSANQPAARSSTQTTNPSSLLNGNMKPVFEAAAMQRLQSRQSRTARSAPQVNSRGGTVALERWYELEVPPGTDIAEAVAELELDGRVEVAEPIWERRITGEPTATSKAELAAVTANDPRKPDQWHLERANVTGAWEWLDDNGFEPWGDRGIVVAVIDSGVDYNHEDLAGNMWVNAGETPNNGIDDDGNGYIDDIYGVSTVGSTFDHTGDPQDDNGHGTHVAGIVAAQGNNSRGVIGVAPNVQIMAIKAAQFSGVLTSTDISEAILYAYQQGADIINMSFGGAGRSVLEEEALTVAFGNSVLVAAAGNNGTYNERQCGDFPPGQQFFPAGYTYVVGVMAESRTTNEDGDWLAAFSNWDCVAQNAIEYEVMAPGEDIWSTTPGNGYAAWDGTSMAAPAVAGVAALVRTRYPDKSVYSSRFVMGQIAAAGTVKQGITPCRGCNPINYRSSDALSAVTDTPKPSLSYLEHFLWDEPATAAANDDDGIVDAGETVELALIIKNYFGDADNVSVTLSAQTSSGGPLDPYVSWDIDTVNYGGVGSFSQDDNGLIFDGGGLLTGVANPFRFSIAANTPNEYVVPILVTMSAENGLDASDNNTYTTISRFSLVVQNGRTLPSVIASDAPGTDGGDVDTDGIENGIVTLDDSALWIIDKPVLIEEGTHLRIGPGAIVQWWGSQPDAAYAVFRNSYLQNEGTLEIAGIEQAPAILKPSDLFPSRGVVIDNRDGATASASYAKISNLARSLESGARNQPFSRFDHVEIRKEIVNAPIAVRSTGTGFSTQFRAGYSVDAVSDTIYGPFVELFDPEAEVRSVLIENNDFDGVLAPSVTDSVFLNNYTNLSGVKIGSNLELDKGFRKNRGLVASTFETGGKTYAVIVGSEVNFTTLDESTKLAQAFSNSLSGHLLVLSNDSEADAVGSWLADVKAEWSAANKLHPLLPECVESPIRCAVYDDFTYAVLGLEKQSNGSFAWVNGETPTLSSDPTADADLQAGYSFGYAISSASSLASIISNSQMSSSGVLGVAPSSWALPVIEVPGSYSAIQLQDAIDTFYDTYTVEAFSSNAILNQWANPDPSEWLTFSSDLRRTSTFIIDDFDPRYDVANNYWGGVSEAVIEKALIGYQQDFNRLPLSAAPILQTAPASAYPFVVNVEILDSDNNPRAGNRFSAETTRWRVTFNRDMDTNIQPQVSFGPDIPYNDFSVSGDWTNPRTWEGTLNISPVATDGVQFVRVAGAVAADDAWLVTGNDTARFSFEVITSGTESLNLQATGGEGFVDLTWTQNDYDTLLGFNIYRSKSPDDGFLRINQTLVGNEDRAYRDDSVEPGENYYYYFTVMLDGAESEPSNTAAATPIDTVAPDLSHAPVNVAGFGSTVLVQAEVNDNIGVESVTLYYRTVGDATYVAVPMANTSGDTYRASIPGSATVAPGVEYYIAASDGASVSYSGRDSNPNVITVTDTPVVTSVSPSIGSTGGGDTITISGANFRAGATVLLGDAACGNVSVESASRITCVTPVSLPDSVSVTVTNSDMGANTLPNAFTFVGNSTTVALPDIEGATGETVQVALSVGPVTGLSSFFTQVTWDTTQLELLSVFKGPLIPGWTMTSAEPSAGTINIAASSATNFAGEGNLVLLEFSVLATESGSSTLNIADVRFNDGAITVISTNGSFTFFEGYSLSGSVRFWADSSRPVSAELSLNGGAPIANAADGTYSFTEVATGQHVLSAAKDDEINDSIRALDASLILSHVVGSATLAGDALLAGDVNANGIVTEQDAARVLEVAAGLRSLPFANQTSPWRFSPATRSLSNVAADTAGLDFNAIFIGDVSGNWATVAAQSLTGVELVLESTENNVAVVDVYATPPVIGESVSAVELNLSLTSGASLGNVSLGDGLANWAAPTISQNNDGVYLATYSDVSNGFAGRTKVFTLSLPVTDNQQAVTELSGWLNEMRFFDAATFYLAPTVDSDGDGVEDRLDAFPDDPAASRDTDGDGLPDDWNAGYSASDSTTGLTIDLDDDGDGYTDLEELEMGTDPADAGDIPVGGLNMAVIKAAIDSANQRQARQ